MQVALFAGAVEQIRNVTVGVKTDCLLVFILIVQGKIWKEAIVVQ
jgi:hypothetical protein